MKESKELESEKFKVEVQQYNRKSVKFKESQTPFYLLIRSDASLHTTDRIGESKELESGKLKVQQYNRKSVKFKESQTPLYLLIRSDASLNTTDRIGFTKENKAQWSLLNSSGVSSKA